MGGPGWQIPWQATLLAASILSSFFLLSQGQAGTTLVTVEPPMPKEGETVTLKPGTIPENSVSCRWYRGEVAPAKVIITFFFFPSPVDRKGPAYTGQETLDSSCSLQITDLKSNYSGTYIVYIDGPVNPATGSANITVIDAPSGGGGGLSGGAIAGIVIGCLAAVILIVGVLYYVCTKTSLGRTEHHISNGNVPSAPGHNQGVTDTKPRSGEEDIQYTTLAFNAKTPPQPASGDAQPSDGTIIYSEIKKK